MTHYLQALDQAGSWYILGSFPSIRRAEMQRKTVRQLFAWMPLRVTVIATGEVAVLDDPRRDA